MISLTIVCGLYKRSKRWRTVKKVKLQLSSNRFYWPQQVATEKNEKNIQSLPIAKVASECSNLMVTTLP